jgi:hypothetical protein
MIVLLHYFLKFSPATALSNPRHKDSRIRERGDVLMDTVEIRIDKE